MFSKHFKLGRKKKSFTLPNSETEVYGTFRPTDEDVKGNKLTRPPAHVSKTDDEKSEHLSIDVHQPVESWKEVKESSDNQYDEIDDDDINKGTYEICDENASLDFSKGGYEVFDEDSSLGSTINDSNSALCKDELITAGLERIFKYEISITTGTHKYVGNVCVTLIGQKASSDKIILRNGELQSNSTVKFHRDILTDLGTLEHLIIEQNNDETEWFCEKVTVYCVTTDIKNKFICKNWISNTRPHDCIRRILYPEKKTVGQADYFEAPEHIIIVSTGTKRNAGTDAIVSITLHGKDNSGYKTVRISPGKCKLGESHTFSTTLSFLVTRVEVGHDNTGESPDWFCDNVIVRYQNTALEQKFSCGQWLSKTKGDGFIVRTLYEQQDINKEGLRELCKQYGRRSTEVANACEHIRLEILVCSSSFKDVWPTYRPAAPDDIVFVVFSEEGSDRNMPDSVANFDIIHRTIGEYSKEDNVMCNIAQLHFPESQEDNKNNLTDILQKKSSHLMKAYSNLNIITASPNKSKGFSLGKHRIKPTPCVVFYVCLKGYIPIQEEELPRKIGKYKTDIREGAFKFYNEPEQYLKRLKMGCSIGEKTEDPTLGGTLGAFVDLQDRKIGCITSAHVLYSKEFLLWLKKENRKIDNFSSEPKIYQPSPALVPVGQTTPFGYVSSAVYQPGGNGSTGVEVGVITITDNSRYPDSGTFPKRDKDDIQLNYTSGKVYNSLPDNISHYTFYKYGAKTGLTRGAFRLVSGCVRTGSLDIRPGCELNKQIEICSVGSKPFAEIGDSGALVLLAPNDNVKDLRAIGIVTGGNIADQIFYITPIWEILRALNLPLQLKVFDILDSAKNVSLTRTASLNSNLKEIERNVSVKVENEIGKVSDKIRNIEDEVETVKSKIENLEGTVDKISSEMSTKTDLHQMATKADLNQMATKADLNQMATKADLNQMATKADLNQMATKVDLNQMATKVDLNQMATKADLNQMATKADLNQIPTKSDFEKIFATYFSANNTNKENG